MKQYERTAIALTAVSVTGATVIVLDTFKLIPGWAGFLRMIPMFSGLSAFWVIAMIEQKRLIHPFHRWWLTKYERDNKHLGWRMWVWNPQRGRLQSPYMGTIWEDKALMADRFSTAEELRGKRGIHASLMRKDWANLEHPDWRFIGRHPGVVVTGVVERYGKFVLGLKGWRAEHAVIKVLRAQCEGDAEALRQAYPDVEVIVERRSKICQLRDTDAEKNR